jgi:TPR repeat protein
MTAHRHIVVALAALAAFTLAAPIPAQPAKKSSPPPPPTAAKTDNGNVDLAYGAFQRGQYLTALDEASKRAQQNDPAAMTLLGELYAQGLGVGRDDSKAAQWYKLAASKGNRDAMFALAMFNLQGRAGPRDRDGAARLLTEAAKLGHAPAAYDLGLLYLEGQQFPQDFGRAADLFKQAANAGNSEAQYALATMYKEGRGVSKDVNEATRLMGLASVAGNLDAMVEFAIAQFNGDGIEKNEPVAANLFLSAARRGSPIAQDRMSHILMAGRGMPTDPTDAVKWHIIAKAGGAGDPDLDVYAGQQPPEVRDAAEKAAKKWLLTLPPRS